jgi:ribosomal protein S5
MEEGAGLVAGQDHLQVLRALGAHDILEPRQVHAKHLAIQKKEGALRA